METMNIYSKDQIYTLNHIDVVKKIEELIKDGEYRYVVNYGDDEPSTIHIVETDNDVDVYKTGWHLWVVKNPETKETEEDTHCEFTQFVTGKWGTDAHCLSGDEIRNFCLFFLGESYNILQANI